MQYADMLRLPTITFKEELKIDLGNQPVQFKKQVNPHSTDGVIVYAEKERVAGLESGRTTLVKYPASEIPSTFAASKSSPGILL